MFDLDETLYPYREYKLSGFRAVAEYVDRQYDVDEQRFLDLLRESIVAHGLSYRHSFDDAVASVDATDVSIPELVEVYRTHEPDIYLPQKSRSVLAQVRDADRFVGIVTEGHRTMQRKKVTALGLEDLVDEIAITEDKTETDAFERVLASRDVAPSDSVYVGDDPSKDFDVPTSLGMVTVRVRTGMHADASVPGPEPTHEVSTLARLPEVLD
jgi:putative hydrolase of the HAD superfamily